MPLQLHMYAGVSANSCHREALAPARATELLLGAVFPSVCYCIVHSTQTNYIVQKYVLSGPCGRCRQSANQPRRWGAGSAQPFGLWGPIRGTLSPIGACGCSTSSKFHPQPEKKKIGIGRRDLVNSSKGKNSKHHEGKSGLSLALSSHPFAR